MIFEYKLKEYQNEDGEYSECLPCNKADIENIIHSYWTGENLPNGLELIVITNSIGQSIILEHSGKEVFEVYFLPVNQNFLFHKKSRIDLIYDTLSAFLNEDVSWLESNLNRTKTKNRQIRKNLETQDFIYEVTPKRIWAQINMTLIFGVPLGIIFIGTSVVLFLKLPHGAIFDIVMPFVFLLGLYLWIPRLIIHSRYKEDNIGLRIRLSKGDDIIHVDINGVEKKLLKAEIAKLTIVNNPLYKLPWSDYGYTEIQFKNGEILNLTNLIIDQFVMVEKFPHCKLLSKTSIYPTLERSTAVK